MSYGKLNSTPLVTTTIKYACLDVLLRTPTTTRRCGSVASVSTRTSSPWVTIQASVRPDHLSHSAMGCGRLGTVRQPGRIFPRISQGSPRHRLDGPLRRQIAAQYHSSGGSIRRILTEAHENKEGRKKSAKKILCWSSKIPARLVKKE